MSENVISIMAVLFIIGSILVLVIFAGYNLINTNPDLITEDNITTFKIGTVYMNYTEWNVPKQIFISGESCWQIECNNTRFDNKSNLNYCFECKEEMRLID
jgi:hypothetical protein